MSETKKLNALGTVATSFSSLYLLCADGDGNAKRVNPAMAITALDYMSVEMPQTGWVRIARNVANNAVAGFMAVTTYASMQCGFLLEIASGQVASFSKNDMKILGAGLSSNDGVKTVIDKVRVLKPNTSGNPIYIDIHILEARKLQVRKGCDIGIELIPFTAVASELETGYSAIEYDLTNSGG